MKHSGINTDVQAWERENDSLYLHENILIK